MSELIYENFLKSSIISNPPVRNFYQNKIIKIPLPNMFLKNLRQSWKSEISIIEKQIFFFKVRIKALLPAVGLGSCGLGSRIKCWPLHLVGPKRPPFLLIFSRFNWPIKCFWKNKPRKETWGTSSENWSFHFAEHTASGGLCPRKFEMMGDMGAQW